VLGRNNYLWCLAVVASAVLLVTASPAVAKSSRGLVFPEGALTVGWKNLEATKRVMVCNGGRTPATLDVRLAGFTFSHTDPKSEAVSKYQPRQVLTVTAPAKVDAGRCGYLKLALSSPPLVIDPGTYPGTIVATAVGLGVVRQELTITGPGKVAAPAAVAAVADPQQLEAKNSFPGGELDLESPDLLLSLPADSVTPTLGAECEKHLSGGWSAKCTSIGNLYKGDDVIEVFLAGPISREDDLARLPIRIEGSGEVGDYEGVLDPAGNGEEAEAVKAKLNLTDSIWWAVLALLIGTAIALLVQLWTGRWRPKRLLQWRKRQLVDSFVEAVEALNARKVNCRDGQVFQVILDEHAVEAYAKEVETAIKSYSWSTLLFNTESDAYKQIESSLTSAEDDSKLLAAESGLQKSFVALGAAVDKTEALLVNYHLVARVPELLTRARALLAETTFSVGDASARAKSATAMAASLKSWQKLAERVLGDEAWLFALARAAASGEPKPIEDGDRPVLSDLAVRLRAIHEELFEAGGDEDLERLRVSVRIETVHGQLAYLAAKYGVYKPAKRPEQLLRMGLLDPVEAAFDGVFEFGEVQADDLRADVGEVKSQPASPVQLPNRRLRLFFFDGLVLALAAVGAIFSGLALFYFGKTFGSWQDYATVVVVGAAAQTVVKSILDNASAFWHDISPLSNLEIAKAKVTPAAK
jgi:hypothetical protein